jgi:hypothetical protein
MTASETVENLIKLGMTIADAVQKKGGSKVDWQGFLASSEYHEIEDKIASLLAKLKKTDIQKTIEAIDEKQTALKGGKELTDLPTDKLIQYAELGNVKVVLAAEKVAAAMNRDFASWLVNEALPVLIKAAPILLPLLL